MATTIKIWEITGGDLVPVEEVNLGATHLEAELEAWICKNSEILGTRLLIIDRQREVQGVGRLDLLAMDSEGKLVIIELKRDRTPREAVAQALDYASWLDSEAEDTIETFAQQYLKRPLADAFLDFFQTELPEFVCQNHRIILVAPRLDGSAERIINYLAERYGVDINAAFFKYSKLSDAKEILARSLLVADARLSGRTQKHPGIDELLGMASERKTASLVEICRRMQQQWQESCRRTYGGSFRYWSRTSSGQDRMVFGVNVAGKYSPPSGHLDIWIPMKGLADATGILENQIRETLRDQHPVFDLQMIDCWIRLKNSGEAEKLVGQLQRWSRDTAAAHV